MWLTVEAESYDRELMALTQARYEANRGLRALGSSRLTDAVRLAANTSAPRLVSTAPLGRTVSFSPACVPCSTPPDAPMPELVRAAARGAGAWDHHQRA
ncbi:hypothetical protein NKH77_51140 [Streptomyces sp. M19]